MNRANPYSIPRWLFATIVTVAVSTAAVLVAVTLLVSRGQPQPTPLGNPPGVADRLVMLDTPDTFATGTTQRARLVASQVTLDDPRPKAFPRSGSWTSDTIKTEFPFKELVPSWNATVPPECGVTLDVRVRDAASQQWLPWVSIGFWGRIPVTNHVRSFPGGRVDTDYLQLSNTADAFQVKVDLLSYSLDPAIIPALRRVAAVYSGIPPRTSAAEPRRPDPDFRAGPIDLPVPYRTQNDAPRPLAWQICSPTSVSMVLSYWGVDRPTVDNALAIYDGENDLFGNWGRAVQFAGSLGLDAWLARFRNWDQVRTELARGTPIVASIKFKKGEFPSNVMSQSAGHLLVIRGLTADGNVICNDPASAKRGDGIVYNAKELAHAWFDHGGVGYVIRGKTPATTRPSTRPAGE